MLYNLLSPFASKMHIANLMHYISFRSSLAFFISFIATLLIGPYIIKKMAEFKQPIRSDGPQTHLKKAGTPTMGGIMILLTAVMTTILLSDLTNVYVWTVLFVLISHGLLGFADDYLKVSRKNTAGVRGKLKLVVQLLISCIAIFIIQKYQGANYNGLLTVPFLKNFTINLGWFYFIFAAVVIIGSSNAVNLTDGLDGLAIIPIIISFTCLGVISYLVGNKVFSDYLFITHIEHTAELAVFASAIIGGSFGFLWYNASPAEIFMGDTGSLSLGSTLGTISVIIKHELVFAIIGGLFVIETLSVIIQVYYFKLSGGRRILLMAPLHHHFEKKGWSEQKVVVRFWILAIIFAILGLSTLKLR